MALQVSSPYLLLISLGPRKLLRLNLSMHTSDMVGPLKSSDWSMESVILHGAIRYKHLEAGAIHLFHIRHEFWDGPVAGELVPRKEG